MGVECSSPTLTKLMGLLLLLLSWPMLEVSAPCAAFTNAGSSGAARVAVASERASRLEKPSGGADGRPPSFWGRSVIMSPCCERRRARATCAVRLEATGGSFSPAQLADMISEPIFDIAGAMEAALPHRLDSYPACGRGQQ